MSAPVLAQELLIQYISELSTCRGYTTLAIWKNKIHEIGTSIAAIDGFYKEYNKSLIRLTELKLDSSKKQLQNEFSQGVSTHPSHIRCNIDIKRDYWLTKLQFALKEQQVVIIKGVSGQGKSALCYRYLLDTYPEESIFCIRTITTEMQAQNLVTALDALGKHNENLVIYIDVQPGEILWAFLIQELQTRGLKIPVLVSIRNEDYNSTPLNGKALKYNVIELVLSKKEAQEIYNTLIIKRAHPIYRTFEDAWLTFGSTGSLIEFIYMLSNNQTLTDRLQYQVEALIKEKVPDDWLDLLLLVCYAGRLGASVDFLLMKQKIHCKTMQSAIQRLKDEYLIRVTNENNKIEALHPVRAKILFDIICKLTGTTENDIVFKIISCIESKNIQIVLMDYFSRQTYNFTDIQQLSQCRFTDWLGFASVIKTMLWLDVKQYVDRNISVIQQLFEKDSVMWLFLLPLDISGIYHPGEIIADKMKDPSIWRDKSLIDETRTKLTSLTLDYKSTDYFIHNSTQPTSLPQTNEDKASFGYALFWMAQRNCKIHAQIDIDKITQDICSDGLQSLADVARGLYEHPDLSEAYQAVIHHLRNKLISEMHVLFFTDDKNEVICKFIPPFDNNEESLLGKRDNSNQFWRIKVFNILQQMYPQKEYIDIELLGVDILDDIGIKPLNSKLRIHKNKRYTHWVTELNRWVKTRIDYIHRPNSWNQYVAKIDTTRKYANDLIKETIKTIDNIYKKGIYTQETQRQIKDKIKRLKRYTYAENLLPISSVDPYCLYSDEEDKKSDTFLMRQLLSVEKYNLFKKYFNEIYLYLISFYNNFDKTLFTRIKKQNITSTRTPNLAMLNLYSAVKTFYYFSHEYDSLFLEYSTLNTSFKQEEIDNFLTLLNVWRHVLDNPPHKQAIAYNAKLQYRNSKTFFQNALDRIPSIVGGTLFVTDHCVYIAKNFSAHEDTAFKEQWIRLVLELKNIFQSDILPSSDRWYCETQQKKLAYIPVISGSYVPIAFSIPFYILFDSDSPTLQTIMFPCEIEQEVKKTIFSQDKVSIWIDSMQKVQEIRLYIKRLHKIIQIKSSENCICTTELFYKKTEAKIQALWKEFAICEKILNELATITDDKVSVMINIIKTFLDDNGNIINTIRQKNSCTKIIQDINLIFTVMLLLQPQVSNIKNKN